MKPTIFIGSSSEGFHIAEQVQSALSQIGDCKIWKEQFDFGNSALEDLVFKLSLYDYGVLVATRDDLTQSRGESKMTARDNVIFEYGLFTGRLGRQRSFLIAESGLKLPSDLNGITLPFFPSSKPNFFQSTKSALDNQKKGLLQTCQKIVDHIKNRAEIFDFGFLPSTALAFGYYNNFLVKVISRLLETHEADVINPDGSPLRKAKFNDVELTVTLPDNLRSDMFDQIKAHRHSNGWSIVKIAPAGLRPFDFHINSNKSNDSMIYLLDIPITLNALIEATHAYIGKSYIGVSEAEKLLESRELRMFKGALQSLIDSNPVTKTRVKIETVSIGA